MQIVGRCITVTLTDQRARQWEQILGISWRFGFPPSRYFKRCFEVGDFVMEFDQYRIFPSGISQKNSSFSYLLAYNVYILRRVVRKLASKSLMPCHDKSLRKTNIPSIYKSKCLFVVCLIIYISSILLNILFWTLFLRQ